MMRQTIQLITNVQGNFEFKYENIDSLDLIESPGCAEKCCLQCELYIGCPKWHLSDIKNMKYYVKHKLEDMKKLQMIDYKSHFKKPCFYCLSSFHVSSLEDGHFNLQKNSKAGKKCVICHRNFTMERSFHHNCNICNASFKNCKLLIHHRTREHNSKKPHQCPVCHHSLSDGVSFSRHIFKHSQPANTFLENLDLKYENIDSLDLIEPKRCIKNRFQQSGFCIGCTNCHFSNMQNLEYFFKHKHEDLELQTFGYKSHFEKPCFNCLSSFHCSTFQDGNFNLQKMSEIKEKCVNCRRYYTMERSFYHNCNVCNTSFANCKLLVHHRRKEHHSINPHQCAVCHLSIANKCLGFHISKHTLPNICPYCNKRYARKTYLKLHILRGCKLSFEKEFRCKLCSKVFNDEYRLKHHTYEHIKDMAYNCSFCNKSFPNFYGLKKHECTNSDTLHRNDESLFNNMLTHPGESIHSCKHCPEKFKIKTSLYRHQFQHINDGQFKCDLCDKTFAKQFMLNQHKKNIHQEKKFQCKYCPKQYKTKIYLDIHLYKHTGGKKFKCDFCDKIFAKRFQLNKHKRTHTILSFQCKYCPKQFKTKSGLDLHLFIKHTGSKKFKCDLCDKTFAKGYMLNRHKLIHIEKLINMEKHMEKSFQCTYCPKQYTTKKYLDIHLFEHGGSKEFKCNFCDKTFAKQFLLNQHKNNIHVDKLFQCKYCPKQFKTKNGLNVHLFEHTGEKKFKCDLCDKICAKRYILNRHKLTHMNKPIYME